jgi:hypothetical protein
MEKQNILNFMEKNKELLLIHTDMQNVEGTKTKRMNIMLTPQFYTLRREAVPVKYIYQAKKIAPSMFDGLLDDTLNYQYYVEKGERWLFIAYDIEKIKSFLVEKGIALENIVKIYFADQSLSHFVSPVLLGTEQALVNLNGIMTVVPQKILDTQSSPIEITSQFIPKKGETFNLASNVSMPNNETYILAAIFILFAAMYTVEGSRYDMQDNKESEKIAELFEAHPSLSSAYTRKNILEKYNRLDKKERQKRKIVKKLSHIIFKGVTLQTLTISDHSVQSTFKCKDQNIVNKLSSLASKEKLISQKGSNNLLSIEGKL